jgi:hypothetical protein
VYLEACDAAWCAVGHGRLWWHGLLRWRWHVLVAPTHALPVRVAWGHSTRALRETREEIAVSGVKMQGKAAAKESKAAEPPWQTGR